jgi:F0F1-type ATP synthase beta subunit
MDAVREMVIANQNHAQLLLGLYAHHVRKQWKSLLSCVVAKRWYVRTKPAQNILLKHAILAKKLVLEKMIVVAQCLYVKQLNVQQSHLYQHAHHVKSFMSQKMIVIVQFTNASHIVQHQLFLLATLFARNV